MRIPHEYFFSIIEAYHSFTVWYLPVYQYLIWASMAKDFSNLLTLRIWNPQRPSQDIVLSTGESISLSLEIVFGSRSSEYAS